MARPKGVAEKKPRQTAARKMAAAAISEGLTPLEYMLGVMRDEAADLDRRDDMAKAAAPFIHARLASIAHTGEDGGPLQIQAVVSDKPLSQSEWEARHSAK